MATETEQSAVNIDRSVGDFHYDVKYDFDAGVGLNERVVNYIAEVKGEDEWVREFRLKALRTFQEKPMPTNWASEDLNAIDFDKIRYDLAPAARARGSSGFYRSRSRSGPRSPSSSASAFPEMCGAL